jgi:hypothetical protein
LRWTFGQPAVSLGPSHGFRKEPEDCMAFPAPGSQNEIAEIQWGDNDI